MSYANLLLHVEDNLHSREATRVAIDLASRFEAYLTAIHIYIPGYHHYVPAGSYPVQPTSESVHRVETEARQLDDALREEFLQRADDARFDRTEWRFHQGEIGETHIAETLARYAKSADLVITHKHDVRDHASQTSYETPALIALASARPVLVLPHTDPDPLSARRLVIGWNGSIESVRAVTAALPIAQHAEKVELVEVNDGTGSGNESESEPTQSASEIQRYLAHHGAHAIYRRLYRGELSVSEALQSQVADSGADLLVIGVYGHSRLREMVFGGVTFELMRTMNIPTLLVG